MTFDDDFMRLNFPDGSTKIYSLKQNDMEWPPPEKIMVDFDGGVVTLRRESYSVITDEERARMTHVCRGAEYRTVEVEHGRS
jgi:hypothetical protein